VVLGGAQFLNARTVLRVLGRDLLSLREPESEGAPIRLSAEFYDEGGDLCLAIEENECKLNPGSWDVETKGTSIIIRSAPGAVVLRIRLRPHELLVERLAMQYRGVRLEANKRQLKVSSSAAQNFRLAGWVSSADTGIEIIRRPSSAFEVREPKRMINLLGTGGNYKVTGRQPPNTEINFVGGARSLMIDADASISIGGLPDTPNAGLALSMRVAASLSVGNLDILIGAGARASGLLLG
jgi:hypothetical protein